MEPFEEKDEAIAVSSEQAMIRKGTIIGVPLATVVAILWAWNGGYENRKVEIVSEARMEWVQDSTAMSARNRNEIQRLKDLHAENVRMHELEDKQDFLMHLLEDMLADLEYGTGRMERRTGRNEEGLAELLRQYLEHEEQADERFDELEAPNSDGKDPN